MFGFLTSLCSMLLVVLYLIFYFSGVLTEVRGFATLVLLLLTSVSLQTLFVGVIGEYVGRIYNNVRGGPLTIVADRIEPVDEGSSAD